MSVLIALTPEAAKKTRRERGSGRIFTRGSRAWMQYSVRGIQHREPILIDGKGLTIDTLNWEKKAAKVLRAKLGRIDAGLPVENRSLTYESMRETYYRYYQAKGHRQSLPRCAEEDVSRRREGRQATSCASYRDA